MVNCGCSGEALIKKELDDLLIKRFPILYQDRRSPMTQTCMCWGFDHGDGWFEIIWQLSLAIESELGYTWFQKRMFLLKKRLARRWNDLIYRLSPVRRDGYKMMGKGTDADPYHQELVNKALPTWDARIAQFLFGRMKKVGRVEIERIGLKNFVWYPYTGFAVSQVKEKFGTLRFYCSGTDKIDQYVTMAEQLSAMTCELCGAPGKLDTTESWYRTLCEKCRGGKDE